MTTQMLAGVQHYQAQEGCTEQECDHPPAARPATEPGPADHLHPSVASRSRRPLGRLQDTFQPSPSVLRLVKQGVFFLVVVVVLVLHAGETNVLLFNDVVSCGGRRHNVTCPSITRTAGGGGADAVTVLLTSD